jgi:hypothetical protein
MTGFLQSARWWMFVPGGIILLVGIGGAIEAGDAPWVVTGIIASLLNATIAWSVWQTSR